MYEITDIEEIITPASEITDIEKEKLDIILSAFLLAYAPKKMIFESALEMLQEVGQ